MKQVIIALIYLAAAKGSLLLAFEGTNATPVWPPSGIALAAVLLLGYRIWPAIFVGALLANVSAFSALAFTLPLSYAGAFATAAGNTLEALLGAFLILHFIRGPDPFASHRDVCKFVLFAAIIPTFVSATIGVSTLAVISGSWENYASIWLTWWLGNGTGILIVTPLILTFQSRIRVWSWQKAAEGAAFLALVLTLGWFIFQRGHHIPYLLLFLLVWIVFRFGHFESCVTMVLIAVMSISGSLHGVGPFVVPSFNESLLLLQGYLSTGSAMAMLLCALITESRRSAELEEANKGLQELERLKSMFIASMSHEFRTPLNSIIGFSSILLNEWPGPVNLEQKENLDAILRSGKHLLTLINDVIDVSKIEAGKIECRLEEFDLHDLVSEAVQYVEKDIREKGLELRLSLQHQRVCSERRRLLQCIINLLSNALKFTKEGSITVEVSRDVDETGAPSRLERLPVRIAVRDTGIGIAAEDIPRMYQPFVRLDSKTMVPGTGLGLYLTGKLVAEVLRGTIRCTSTPGVGSTFTISIPERIDDKAADSPV